MNTYLESIINENMFKDINNNAVDLNWHITKEEGLVLQDLIKENNISKTLEIGTAYGISSIFICDAIKENKNARHITMDPFQDTVFKNNGINNIKKSGLYDLVDFYNDYSYYVLPDLLRRNINVDMVFIDGYHTFDYAFVDFFYSDMLLKRGGLLILDDSIWPSVKKVAEYIVTNRAYQLVYPSTRNTGKYSWKHNLFIGFMKLIGKYEMIDERLRKIEEYEPAYRLPLSKRFMVFKKIMDDKEFREEETFHKVF